MNIRRKDTRTAADIARQRRLNAARQPLSMGVATAAKHRPELAAQREGAAVSVLSPGVVPGAQMRQRAFAAPGAFFGGDVPVRMVPMDDWAEQEWTAFFRAAGWSPGEASAMAQGARPGEFAARPERRVMVMPGQRERHLAGPGRWDGLTGRVREEMELGFHGGLEALSQKMNVCRDRVAQAMNRLASRGVVVSDNRRPATYALNRGKKGRAA